MITFRLFTILLLFAGCTELTATRLPSKPIGSDFKLTGMRWSNGTIMLVAVELSQRGKNTAVCGAWALPNDADDAASRLTDEVLANADIVVDDEVVVDTAGYFAQARHQGLKLPAGQANCIETTTPWQNKYRTARPKFVVTKRVFTLVD